MQRGGETLQLVLKRGLPCWEAGETWGSSSERTGGRSGGAWWGEAAAHSQRAGGRTRTELVSGELDRLVSYAAKGDLISPTEALQMLDERDRDQVSATVMTASPSAAAKTQNLHQQGCTIVYGCKEGICDD